MQMMPDRGADRTSSVLRPINATIRHHLHSKVGGVKCVRTTTQRQRYFESGFIQVQSHAASFFTLTRHQRDLLATSRHHPYTTNITSTMAGDALGPSCNALGWDARRSHDF
jgi:hypothetical protein